MKTELLAILACPECKGELDYCGTILSENGYVEFPEEVTSGELVCRKCNERYPIEDGIPNMLPRKLRPHV